MATRIARLLSRGNGHTPEEVESILQRRRTDIDCYGYWFAFKRDSISSFEKYEYQKNNLGGIM